MAELKPIEVVMRIDFASSNGIEVVAHAERVSELVRCKDCIHRNKYECNHIMLGGTKCGVTDDWYCADGERKEIEDEHDL